MFNLAQFIRNVTAMIPATVPAAVVGGVRGPTPEQFIEDYIRTHEGGMSVDPVDTGNWFKGKLVGSKFGVTGATLARFRGVQNITQQQMRELTLNEAVQVGVQLFYENPGFDLLPWNQVSASVLDMGWGAGPRQAIKLLQRMIGTGADGRIGQFTVAAFVDYLAQHGLEKSARDYGAVRNRFYDLIIARRPANRRYRNGWRNRTASFLPGTRFWRQWG